MNFQLPIIVKYNIKGITIEFCYGNIPDIFRELWFDPIKELELPDRKGQMKILRIGYLYIVIQHLIWNVYYWRNLNEIL